MVRIVLFAAAEKRDYAAILQSRQPLLFASSQISLETCSRNHLITLTFSVSAEAEANYTKPATQSARDYKEKILSYKSQSIGSQPNPCTTARFHHVVPGSTSCRMILPSRPSSQ